MKTKSEVQDLTLLMKTKSIIGKNKWIKYQKEIKYVGENGK